MNVQAEVSLYPLRATLTEPIESFLRRVREHGLEVTTGTMSSRVAGECKHLFAALGEAFEDAAGGGDVVLVVKVSNACPPAGERERDAGEST